MDIAASPPSQARPAELDTLLSSPDQYTPEAIAPLEAYVAQQVQGKQYDAAANKALAKLYQFTPSRCQDAVLAQVLAAAAAPRFHRSRKRGLAAAPTAHQVLLRF